MMNKEKEIITLDNIGFLYEGEEKAVWENLSCRFYEGKIHAISGISGCGKSSLLYYISGIIPYLIEGKASGRIYYQGEDITEMSPSDRFDKISLVMQDAESQFCTFTVEDEVAFGLESLGMTQERMYARIREVLHEVGLDGFQMRDLYTLSGGEMQRLSIACALASDSKVILLDEPTANLDPKSRQCIFDLLLHLAKNKNKTIILIEHNLEEIIDDIDYFYYLDKTEGLLCIDKKKRAVSEEYLQLRALWEKRPTASTKISSKISSKEVFRVSNLSHTYERISKRGMEREHGSAEYSLKNLSFTIYQGDFLAIVGPSGAGKSTLIKLLMSRLDKYTGDIYFGTKNIKKIKKKDLYAKVGMVFQNPEHQFLTNAVYDEMLLSFRNYPKKATDAEALAKEALQKYDLDGQCSQSPFTLSQGQKRRLSVAVMLPMDKEVLILDEPTYGQDIYNRITMMENMKRLNEEGLTLIMITHDLSLVRAYANRVLELSDGQIIFDGDSETYFERG